MGVGRRPAKQVFQTLNNANARLLLLLLLFLLVADAEIADAWAPPHSTRLLLFPLFCARLACGLFLDFYLSVFF